MKTPKGNQIPFSLDLLAFLEYPFLSFVKYELVGEILQVGNTQKDAAYDVMLAFGFFEDLVWKTLNELLIKVCHFMCFLFYRSVFAVRECDMTWVFFNFSFVLDLGL